MTTFIILSSLSNIYSVLKLFHSFCTKSYVFSELARFKSGNSQPVIMTASSRQRASVFPWLTIFCCTCAFYLNALTSVHTTLLRTRISVCLTGQVHSKQTINRGTERCSAVRLDGNTQWGTHVCERPGGGRKFSSLFLLSRTRPLSVWECPMHINLLAEATCSSPAAKT